MQREMEAAHLLLQSVAQEALSLTFTFGNSIQHLDLQIADRKEEEKIYSSLKLFGTRHYSL